MADERKEPHWLVEFIKGFGSTRFGVVLAAMGLIYCVVKLVTEAASPSDGVLWLAELGCCLIAGLGVVHMGLRTFKGGTNGNEEGRSEAEPGGSLPGAEDPG